MLLSAAVPAHLATIDPGRFPHVTPLWFIWADHAFYLTSIPDRPHLKRMRANPDSGICIDAERPERDNGQRPNRQVRAVGLAKLFNDNRAWTARISEKYFRGPGASAMRASRSAGARVVTRLRSDRLVAAASV